MSSPLDFDRIQRWIVVYLAVISGEDSATIDVDASLSTYDMDSVDAVEMAMQFEKTFGREIGAEFFLRSKPSLKELAEQIVADAAERA